MNKLLFLLLALVPLLLVLTLPLANAQLPFLPGTGNITHLPMPQPTTKSNLTAIPQSTTSSNLTAQPGQCGILPCGPGDNASNSPFLPHSLVQSILKQTQTNQMEMKKGLNATGPEFTDTTSMQNITARVNSELKNGTISSNGTFLVIYAYHSLGPVGWSGSILSIGNSATQDGTGRAVIPIDCTSTMSFQKQEENGYLSLTIVNDGKIVNQELTNSPYGVVTMVANCNGEAPLVPTVNQATPTANQTAKQNTPNQLTRGNLIPATPSTQQQPMTNFTSPTVSQPIFGTGLRNVLTQIPSTAADYPNKDPNSVKFLDVKALKGGLYDYVHITGTLLSLSNRTLYYPTPIVYLFDKNNQSVGEVTNGLFISTELPPHTSGTFDVNIDPSLLTHQPTSYQLRFEGTFQ